MSEAALISIERPAPPRALSTEGEVIYAVGDIHGCYGLLKSALAQIAVDCGDEGFGEGGRRRPMLVFLGDYVDRGPDSAKVLQAMVWLKRRGEFALRLLKGNHEQALLAFLEDPEANVDWLSYGGAETLVSYGVTPPPRGAGVLALGRARDALLDLMPASHLQLLEELEPMVLVGDYAFVHAGVRPDRPLARQAENDLLWIRGDFIDAPGPFERVIVHGHTWFNDQPQVTEHRIGLDTGAYATGVLTVARLDQAGMRLVQVRG